MVFLLLIVPFCRIKKIVCSFFALFYPVAFRPEDCCLAFIFLLMLEFLFKVIILFKDSVNVIKVLAIADFYQALLVV